MTVRVAFALVCCLLATGLEAQEAVAGWQAELRDIGRELLSEEFESAEHRALAVSQEMIDTIAGGVGADMLLGMATTYRALAVAGQGRGDEAIWHWQVAQQMYPQVREIDLARFGPMGAFLRMNPPRGPSDEPDATQPGAPDPDGEFRPPTRIESPLPDFPNGRAFRGLRVDVVVQVVVGTDGVPSQPLILESEGEATLVWSTLEALRKWRFEPGRRNGEPEASLYKLTASYVVPTD
jgi:TonB family protein